MTGLRMLDEGERWLFGRKRAAYGMSAMRILLGVAILGSLVVNFADRLYVWGPGARWLAPWLTVDHWGFPFTAVFGESDSSLVFTLKYLVLMVVAVLFTLGWRTRVLTPVLLLMLTSLMRLNPLATDAGDNLIRISLLFFCIADVSMHWSLDARRRGRRREAATLKAASETEPDVRRRTWSRPAWPGVLFHNVALLGIAGQVFVVYVVSGMSKVQGSMWQEGVGLYYPLQIDQYASFPALNEIVYASGVLVTIGSYLTVFVQMFFPLLLMRRGTRVVALALVFGMHVGIAVTMALPWFSLAILAADAIFIRDDTYRSAIAWVRRRRAARHGRDSGADDEGSVDDAAGGAQDGPQVGEPAPAS